MDPVLVKFFKAAMPSSPMVPEPDKLQAEALKRGFIIHPSVLNEDVAGFVVAETIDPNSTFYRAWEDVVSKDRFSLFLDQVAHYATTYGTCYNLEGNGYVPNEGAEAPDFTEYTLIGPIEAEELYSRCLRLISGGVALKSGTVAAVCDQIVEYLGSPNSTGTGIKFDIDSVTNREALSILASKLGKRPSDPVALLRFIIYESTGETLLIKSPELFNKIITSDRQFDFNQLDDSETDSLASIFLRFKSLFLAFRSHRTRFFDTVKKEMVMEATPSRPVINRIRRKAELLHKTVKPGFWETVLSSEHPVGEIADRLQGLSAFKLVSLLQTIRERILMVGEESKRLFTIRNGKAYVKPLEPGRYVGLTHYYQELERLFEDRLVSLLSPKACSVRFPGQITLACPTSEKNFMGNYPFGSWYPMEGNNFFGIYWRNEWGTHDFDISFVYLKGGKIGWNEVYNDSGHAVYSGDMTNADPEASEIFYCKGTCGDGIVFCNRYNGEEGSRFRFFFGQEEITDLKHNYMVDPNCLVINEDLTSGLRQMMLAAVSGGRIYLMSVAVGNSRVSSGMDAADKSAIIARKARCFVDLRTILLKAGFTEAAADGTPDIDLSDMRKDTLISLFSE